MKVNWNKGAFSKRGSGRKVVKSISKRMLKGAKRIVREIKEK